MNLSPELSRALSKIKTVRTEGAIHNQALIYDSGLGVYRPVTISSASGQANTASNVGVGGVGLYKQKTGLDLEFKNINAGSSKVTITDDVANNEVDVNIVENQIIHQNLNGAGSYTHSQIDSYIDSGYVQFIVNVNTSGVAKGCDSIVALVAHWIVLVKYNDEIFTTNIEATQPGISGILYPNIHGYIYTDNFPNEVAISVTYSGGQLKLFVTQNTGTDNLNIYIRRIKII